MIYTPLPHPPSSVLSDLKVYNIGCHQDTQALKKVPNHMDEGSSDTRVLLLVGIIMAGVIMAVPMVVTVSMSRLMKG